MSETEPIKLTYGERTFMRLEELLDCQSELVENQTKNRARLPVPTEFWDWRKENKDRARVLSQAGLLLWREDDQYGRGQWFADLTKVDPDTLDEARDGNIERRRSEKEWKERA